MAKLGATRYGLSFVFREDATGKTTTKTINGFNFAAGGASAIANEANMFFTGNKYSGGEMPGLTLILDSDNYSVPTFEVISRNAIEDMMEGA